MFIQIIWMQPASNITKLLGNHIQFSNFVAAVLSEINSLPTKIG